jgi:hypothetical protein
LNGIISTVFDRLKFLPVEGTRLLFLETNEDSLTNVREDKDKYN